MFANWYAKLNFFCLATFQPVNAHGDSGVRSLKELWEGNVNSHSHNSDTVMGTGREAGIFL